MDLGAVVETLRRTGARFAYVHGSRADGRSRVDSDLDVAARFGGRVDPDRIQPALPGGWIYSSSTTRRSSLRDVSPCEAGYRSTTTRPRGCGGKPRPAGSTRTRRPGRRPAGGGHLDRLADLDRLVDALAPLVGDVDGQNSDT